MFVDALIRFLLDAVPKTWAVLCFAPLFAIFAWFCGMVVGRLKIRKGLKTAYTRKIFHFAIFSMAAVIQVVMGLSGVVLYGVVTTAVIVFAIIKGDGYPFYEAIARESDAPRRSFFVIVPLICTALGGVLSNILFPGFAAVGYMVTGWGDAVAEPIGSKFGRHFYRVPSIAGVKAKRSLEGSLSVFIAGVLAAFITLNATGVYPLEALWVATLVALGATAVEAISTHGFDNLTIQLVASGVAFWLLK